MAYNQTPEKFRLDIIVLMYYSVACVDYSSCIWNFNRLIGFPYAVYGFSHDFSLALDDTFAHYVFFKQVISVWKADKATLHIIDCIQYILDRSDFFNSHKSSVSCDLHLQ